MAKILKFKRGNTAKNNAYTGSAGELTVDTTKKTVVVHDGVTAGGSVLATDVTVSTHTSRVDNPHGVSKTQVGLGNVLNVDSTNPNNIVQDSTHRFVTDSDKTNWNGKINATEKAVANGVATLDVNGKVVLTQIPDSVLGQLEYMGTHSFSGGMPTATQKGQYWIASADGNGYITGDWAVWNGASFDKVDNTDAVATVAGRTGNVVLTKNDVGLANVDNTSDANKPVSTATQTVLNNKVNKVTSTDNAIVRFDGTTGAVQNSGVIIDDAGNVGIGVPPSPWAGKEYGSFIDIGNGRGSICSALFYNNSNIFMSANSYLNASFQEVYKGNYTASKYLQTGGVHSWHTAPLGTTGNPITWTDAMTLNANGNLLVGTSTDNGVDKLQVNGSISANMYKGAITEFGGFIPILNSGVNNGYAGSSFSTANITDLNNLTRSGTYNCSDIANAPVSGWIFVQHMQHSDVSKNEWAQQIVTTMGAGNIPNQMYIRTKVGGTWTAWVEK